VSFLRAFLFILMLNIGFTQGFHQFFFVGYLVFFFDGFSFFLGWLFDGYEFFDEFLIEESEFL